MSRLFKRSLITTLALAALVYLALCFFMWQTQRHFIFLPSQVLQTTPDRVGIPHYEVVHIPSGSGSERGELYGWWLPAAQPNAPTLLYLHGNGENISQSLFKGDQLYGMGYNLLLVDYRGYGESTGGEPSEAKSYEDADAAWNYLLKRAGRNKSIFIYGHSLGGAIAIDLAIHHPEATGLIAESTFTTMSDMGKRQYNFLPVDLLLNQRFDSLGKVGRLKIPVLYIHGMLDTLIPYGMSERLFEKSPQPKFFKTIKGGGHDDSSTVGWTEYRDAVGEFVKKYAH